MGDTPHGVNSGGFCEHPCVRAGQSNVSSRRLGGQRRRRGIPSGGAVPGPASMPCGDVGNENTWVFRPLAPERTSGRLFFRAGRIPCHQALTNVPAGIMIGVHFFRADATPHQGSTGPIALSWRASTVAGDQGATPSTLAARVLGIDPAGDDPDVPGFIPGKAEDRAPEPEGPFGIGAPRIPAPFRPKMSQMLKHQHGRCLRCREIDDAAAQAMGGILVQMADRGPERDVVLLSLGNDAGFAPVAGNPSK